MFYTPNNSGTPSVFESITEDIIEKIRNDNLCLHSPFYLNNNQTQEIYLAMTTNYIALGQKTPFNYRYRYYTELSFDLKFQVIYQGGNTGNAAECSIFSKPIGFRLIRQKAEPIEFVIVSQNVLQIWLKYLSKTINQYGFHKMFKPVRKLGKGGFATVYQVQRLTDGKFFAVKAFSKQNTLNSPNESHKLNLLNQIKMMRAVDNPNVIKLEGIFESDNSLYIVLQLLSGGQLHSKVNRRQGKFTQKEIKQFMIGLIKGLKELHDKDIMHRDIKPENIMLRSTIGLDPVIVDFGLAANVLSDDYIFYRCGTPGYVSPQVCTLAKGQKISPICDIFSAGVIFHILLTCKPLFTGTKFEQVYQNNRKMNFNLKGPGYAHIEAQAMDLLERMLRINPSQRISAAEILQHPYLADFVMQEEKIEKLSPVTETSTRKICERVY